MKPIGAGEVHVWRFSLTSDAVLARLEATLSQPKTRADRCRFERDRRRFIVGRAIYRDVWRLPGPPPAEVHDVSAAPGRTVVWRLLPQPVALRMNWNCGGHRNGRWGRRPVPRADRGRSSGRACRADARSVPAGRNAACLAACGLLLRLDAKKPCWQAAIGRRSVATSRSASIPPGPSSGSRTSARGSAASGRSRRFHPPPGMAPRSR